MPPLAAFVPEIIAGATDAAAVGGEAAAGAGAAAAEAGAAAGEGAAAAGEGTAAAGEGAGSSSFSDIFNNINNGMNIMQSIGSYGSGNNSGSSIPTPNIGLGPVVTGGQGSSEGADGAGGAGGFDGDFNDLANGADFNNANSLLGVQTQADQQQTMMELAAKLESIQKETDQAIIQDM